MLFDTHAHYDDKRFDPDRDELLASLPAHDIGLILNPGCDVETSRKAVSYAQKYAFVYAAVGIHPENINESWNNDLSVIQELAQTEPKVRAIGEIGLDYYWEKDEHARARQQVVFARQMELARELNMPVIVHDRDAHGDCMEITRRYPEVRGVYHCYAGSVEMARELLRLGYYLSFTGVITFKNARRAIEVIREVPIDRLMIETDAPYMTPEPFRGRRNSSLYVYRMAETIAEIKGMSVEEVERITTENGKRLFAIS
ncbi:MAG TPA: TatD family hydrolase [Candidatus Agathobaculum merdigallinarum]|nr:TatD family hydrolase [Candidatus Agathobaculum merdigallinarum]